MSQCFDMCLFAMRTDAQHLRFIQPQITYLSFHSRSIERLHWTSNQCLRFRIKLSILLWWAHAEKNSIFAILWQAFLMLSFLLPFLTTRNQRNITDILYWLTASPALNKADVLLWKRSGTYLGMAPACLTVARLSTLSKVAKSTVMRHLFLRSPVFHSQRKATGVSGTS